MSDRNLIINIYEDKVQILHWDSFSFFDRIRLIICILFGLEITLINTKGKLIIDGKQFSLNKLRTELNKKCQE